MRLGSLFLLRRIKTTHKDVSNLKRAVAAGSCEFMRIHNRGPSVKTQQTNNTQCKQFKGGLSSREIAESHASQFAEARGRSREGFGQNNPIDGDMRANMTCLNRHVHFLLMLLLLLRRLLLLLLLITTPPAAAAAATAATAATTTPATSAITSAAATTTMYSMYYIGCP